MQYFSLFWPASFSGKSLNMSLKNTTTALTVCCWIFGQLSQKGSVLWYSSKKFWPVSQHLRKWLDDMYITQKPFNNPSLYQNDRKPITQTNNQTIHTQTQFPSKRTPTPPPFIHFPCRACIIPTTIEVTFWNGNSACFWHQKIHYRFTDGSLDMYCTFIM